MKKRCSKNRDSKLTLCLIAVIVTSIIIFISINALSLLEESMKQDLRQTQAGCSEYVVKSKDGNLFEFDGNIEAESLPIISLRGKIASGSDYLGCNIWGVDYNKFLYVFGDTYKKSGDVEYPSSLNVKQIIVSPKICDKLKLNENDTVELSFKGVTLELKVVFAPKDNYFAKSNEELIIINKNIFGDLLENSEKMASEIYLYNVQDEIDFKDGFLETYPDLEINESIDPVYISQNMITYYGVEFFIFIFILLVAYDVISSSGKIYVIEKSKEIGALRSVGYTKTNLRFQYKKLAFELAIKGIVISIIVGTLGIYSIAKFVVGLKEPLKGFDLVYYTVAALFTFIVMVIMCQLSFIKPLNRLFRRTDRELLLEDASSELKVIKVEKRNIIFVLIFILLCIVFHSNIKMSMYLSIGLSIVYFLSLFKSVKFMFILFAEKIRKMVRRGTFTIALKNVAGNYYLRKTLNLTIIVSLFVIIIGTLIFSVLSAMTSFYKDYKVDAFLRTESDVEISDVEIGKIRALNEVSYSYTYHRGSGTIKVNSDSRRVAVVGIDDPIEYDNECMNLHLKWLEDFEPKSFNSDNNAIVSEILMVRYGLEIGDEIEFDDGKFQKKYKIVASTSSLQELGDLVYVSRYDKEMFDSSILNGIYFKSNNVAKLEDKVSGILYDNDFTFKDVTNIRENDITNGMQVITFFVIFALLVTFTSITGIYSNYKLSYVMRKKELAILGSMGYNKKHILNILGKEVMIISLLSYVVGGGILLVLKKPLEIFLSFVDLPVQIQINLYIFAGLFIIILFMTMINIILAKRSCRNVNEDLIEEIKR